MDVDSEAWRKEYPFDSHFLDVDGARMHYVDEGRGPAIVLLHGNPTWSFHFRTLIRALRTRWRVIAPDHIGCGLSDKPQTYDYTLATHIRNLGRLLDHLRPGNVTLAVHDWGGAIGLGWAVTHPGRVSRLVLFNTTAFLGPCPLRIRVCRTFVLGDLMVRGFNVFVRAALRMAPVRSRPIPPQVRAGYLRPYDNWANRVAVLRFVRDIPLRAAQPSFEIVNSIDRSLATLRGRPVLILWGARDFCFHDGYLQEWRIRFPEARVHRFPDAGHFVVEDASTEILPILEGFLSEADAPSASSRAGLSSFPVPT